MNNIKFRVKHATGGYWLYATIAKLTNIERYQIVYFLDRLHERPTNEKFPPIDKDTVCLGSCKPDKHGVEIYERDILYEKFEADGETHHSHLPVHYCEINAAFVVDISHKKDGTCLELLSEQDTSELKIVGNTIDNPTLIE